VHHDVRAHLGIVGQLLTKQSPDFDSRTYGYTKLSDLLTATALFDLDRARPGVIQVRDRRRRPRPVA